jgi:hypothetical protein
MKNFCTNCGRALEIDEKYCRNCGSSFKKQTEEEFKMQSDTIQREENNDLIEKREFKNYKKIITLTRKVIVWIGWWSIISPLPLYIIALLIKITDQTGSFDLPNVVWIFGEGVIMVVAGKRIQHQSINTRKYIIALLCLFILLSIILPSIFSLIGGGLWLRGGDIINIFLILLLFVALISFNKVYQDRRYRMIFQEINYKFKGIYLFLLGLGFFVIFILASFLDHINPVF